jgi:hypothetical protein
MAATFADDLKPSLDGLQKAQDVMRTHWAEKRGQGRKVLGRSRDEAKAYNPKIEATTERL